MNVQVVDIFENVEKLYTLESVYRGKRIPWKAYTVESVYLGKRIPWKALIYMFQQLPNTLSTSAKRC